jgi:hypothetical protein
MTSFTNFDSFFFWAWAWAWRGRGLAWLGVRVGFAFACHVHAQGKHFQGKCSGACFWLQRLLVGNVALCRVRNRQALYAQLGQN